MAHFIYEYSANLPADQLDMSGLMAKMHKAADTSGVFPLAGLRSRAIRCEEFRVGDGNPDNGFVNLSIKVGRGRDLDTRMDIGQTLFDILIEHLQPLFDSRGLAVSFEMRQLEEHVKFNKKNI
jgi:5-carboxymethyl-2-hydroxymuconate isomerase